MNIRLPYLRLPLTKRQRALQKKHGLPSQFAAAVYAAVPGRISMDEAAAAVQKYNDDWRKAGRKGTR